MGGHDRAGGADPVAAVEVLDVGEGVLAELVAGGQQLQRSGLVGERGEHQAAVASHQHQPAGDAHRLAGLRVGRQSGEALAHGGDGVVAAEADRVRLDAALAQALELLEPVRALAVDDGLVDEHHATSFSGAPATRSPSRRPARDSGREAAKRASARARRAAS